MKGIDVSQWQGTIDWAKVKAAGVEFAIIRAGLRGYAPEGNLAEDTRFRDNIQGASSAGIPVGVYFLTQAITPEEGREEARYCLQLVRPYKLDFPVFVDTEYSDVYPAGRADVLTKEARTAAVTAFCAEVEAAGYYVGIYASSGWFSQMLGDVSRYDRWIAKWDGRPITAHGMWQYSKSGQIPGILTNVDLNEARKDYPAIIQGAGLNQPGDQCDELRAEVERLQKEVIELRSELAQVEAEKQDILNRLQAIVCDYSEEG